MSKATVKIKWTPENTVTVRVSGPWLTVLKALARVGTELKNEGLRRQPRGLNRERRSAQNFGPNPLGEMPHQMGGDASEYDDV